MIHKRNTPMELSVKILLEGLNSFVAPTSPLVQMMIKTHRCLACIKDPELIHPSSSSRTYKSRYVNMTQQYIKLNIGAI